CRSERVSAVQVGQRSSQRLQQTSRRHLRECDRRALLKPAERRGRVGKRTDQFIVVKVMRFQMQRLDLEMTRLALHLAVHASDELIAKEQRQAEVSELPLRSGYVTLDLVVELEQ